MNNLIAVKQLPIIEEQLRTLSAEIDKTVSEAMSLACTDDTVKDVKKVRSALNAQFKELEEQRKAVKAAVLDPYNAFEAVYKECVTTKFNAADASLKRKIGDVEGEQKAQKTTNVLEYFNEYAASLHIDWLKFESSGLNITLSASEKSLKEQAKAFIDKVNDDLAVIATNENESEILVEYKHCMNLAQSITFVTERKRLLAEIEAQKAEKAAVVQAGKEAAKVVETIAPHVSFAPPVVASAPEPTKQEADPKLKLSFTVTAPKTRLQALKKFLEDGGYQYE